MDVLGLKQGWFLPCISSGRKDAQNSDLTARYIVTPLEKHLHLTSSGAHSLHYTCQSYFHQEMPSMCPLANIFAEFTTFSNLLASTMQYS